MTGPHHKIDSFRQRLQFDFPSLEISSIKIMGSGWDHDAVEVNGDIVFRIPKDYFDASQPSPAVLYETKLLKLLHSKLPIAIPYPQYISPHKSYFGYTKLAGTLLGDDVDSFTEQDLERLQEDWASVAAAIHAGININQARKFELPNFEGWDTSVAERIFSLSDVNKLTLEWASKIINKVHSLNSESQYNVVAHNDLRFQNILVDPNSKNISGVIDWSDICIAPVAREFAASDWENEALNQVIRLYESATGVVVNVEQVGMWRHLEDISDFVELTESGEVSEASRILERLKEVHGF